MASQQVEQAAALLRGKVDPDLPNRVSRDREFLIAVAHAVGLDGDDPYQQAQVAALLGVMKIGTHSEYPKWVKRDGQPDVLAHSAEHEAELTEIPKS